MKSDQQDEIERRADQALRSHFKPEFLIRVDEVIIYHQLAREQIGLIAEIQLDRVRKLLAAKRIELEVDERARALIAERGFDPHYGARPLKRVIQRLIQDPLAMRILEGEFPEGSKISVTTSSDTDPSKETLLFSKI